MNPRIVLLLSCSLLTLFAACTGSGKDKLNRVHGTVVFQGKPVPKGTIFFDPDGSKGGGGAQGFADIVDGKFDTKTSGLGIKQGPFLVRIQGFDGIAGNELPYGNPLFLEHEVKRVFPDEDTLWEIDVAAKPFKK
jgi:hypothetical protein